MAALGLHCCAQAFSSCGYSSLRCAGFIVVASLVGEHNCSRRAGFSSCDMQASVVVAHRLSSCGTWA